MEKIDRKIVAVSGYFDPVHKGHIELFRRAKSLYNNCLLVVILNSDRQAAMKKGESFMDEDEREVILRSIKYVDDVVISIDQDLTVCETLKKVKPDVFANGGDRSNKEIPEAKICEEYGIEMVDGLGKKIQSSSELVRRSKERSKVIAKKDKKMKRKGTFVENLKVIGSGIIKSGSSALKAMEDVSNIEENVLSGSSPIKTKTVKKKKKKKGDSEKRRIKIMDEEELMKRMDDMINKNVGGF